MEHLCSYCNKLLSQNPKQVLASMLHRSQMELLTQCVLRIFRLQRHSVQSSAVRVACHLTAPQDPRLGYLPKFIL